MVHPRVKDYFLSCDPLRPDIDRLDEMEELELKQVIESQADMWVMPVPELCGKTKKELIQIIITMAKEADAN